MRNQTITKGMQLKLIMKSIVGPAMVTTTTTTTILIATCLLSKGHVVSHDPEPLYLFCCTPRNPTGYQVPPTTNFSTRSCR